MRAGGAVEKLAAVFTLYCLILNLFSAVRTPLHNLLPFDTAVEFAPQTGIMRVIHNCSIF